MQSEADILRLIKRLKELSDTVDFLRQKYPTDVQLLPSADNGGFPVPAHIKFLAARSNVFKNMLDEDGVMEVSANDTIALPDLSKEELNCFLEFMYTGKLSKAGLEKHFKALFIAAHKYDVPSLEACLLAEIDTKNALHVLEVSDSCSIKKSKEYAQTFVVNNFEEIVFSEEYAVFSKRNHALSLEIQRATCKRPKVSRSSSPSSSVRRYPPTPFHPDTFHNGRDLYNPQPDLYGQGSPV